jgi:uncharacterized membrane protein YeaQ/YmgE (transglycosylase-associated protein family)
MTAPGSDSFVAGLIIGALARLLLPGRQEVGLLWTLALGVAGSVIGGTIANLIGTGDIMELNVIGFIVAVLALGRVAGRRRACRARAGRGSQAARPRLIAPANAAQPPQPRCVATALWDSAPLQPWQRLCRWRRSRRWQRRRH